MTFPALSISISCPKETQTKTQKPNQTTNKQKKKKGGRERIRDRDVKNICCKKNLLGVFEGSERAGTAETSPRSALKEPHFNLLVAAAALPGADPKEK